MYNQLESKMVKLTKVELADKHLIYGNEFPVAYTLSSKASPDEIEDLLQQEAKRGFFNEILRKNGAVVLRFGITDPDIISKFIKAIGYGSGDTPFVQNGSTAQRTQITDVLTTANEGPGDLDIYQHNEFSRFKSYPSKLFFACTEYTAKGGETPIVHGAEIFKDIQKKDPEFIRSLSTRGLLFEQTWNYDNSEGVNWTDKYSFGRLIKAGDSLEEKKEKARKISKEHISEDISWTKNNDLVVKEHTEPLKLYDNGEKKYGVFFNSIPAYYGYIAYQVKGYGNDSKILYDDNQEPIPRKDLDIALESSFSTEYNHKWQAGDLAIIDNLQVSHGRKPWRDGKRKILVSMWNNPHRKEFPKYEA